MRDTSLLVLIVVMAVTLIIRGAMIAQMQRWPAELKLRQVDSFHQQRKWTTFVLVAFMLALVVPTLLGVDSTAIAVAVIGGAIGLSLYGGITVLLKLRRLDFPASYIRLHAINSAIMTAGMTAYALMLLRG